MSVRVEHLRKVIGQQTILGDVSFSIGEGEVLGLLGPNGAGKSTLMKILVGLWPFESGSVEVCDIDMASRPHDVAPYIGYLPENNPLYDDMYIREYLDFMASLGGVGHEVVERVIAEVGLLPEISKKIGQLSKGYRQRVGLAQALLQDPQLLILDEPTTGLDPNQLDEIRAMIRTLGKNRTIILSTHIMQEVKEMCSRVIILSHGEIKADIVDISGVDLEETFRSLTK